MFKYLTLPFAAIALFLLPAASFAQENSPTQISNFRDWFVFTQQSPDGLVCFAQTAAINARPKNVRHGNVYALLSLWASGRKQVEPSIQFAYLLDTKSAARLKIDKLSWNMTSGERNAYILAEADERSLIANMRKGRRMRLDARSRRGTRTSYEFSLFGVSASLNKIKELCAAR